MIVLKFGGTSVSTPDRIFTICKIVKKEIAKNPIVVVSALKGVTDALYSLSSLSKKKQQVKLEELKKAHFELIKNVLHDTRLSDAKGYIEKNLKSIEKFLNVKIKDKAFYDKIASHGEIMSSFIISKAIEESGIKSTQVLSTDFIITDNSFGSAEFIPEKTRTNSQKVLLPLLKKEIVPVVTGFIGSTSAGDVTTLGRGGSDYTASIIGFSLGASEIQIWTDVNGVFSADPRLVENAKILSSISYSEASELATFGAKVLHPRTIKPAIENGIPVRVLNTLNPLSRGTLIIKNSVNSAPITAISFKRKVTLVNITSEKMFLKKGFLAIIFEIFSKNGISIDLVSVSEISVSVTLDNDENLEKTISDLSKFSTVYVRKELGMVSLIGEGIVGSSSCIKKIFELLDQSNILVKMISLGARDINVSIIVAKSDVEKAVRVLHDKLLIKLWNKEQKKVKEDIIRQSKAYRIKKNKEIKTVN